MNLHAHHKAAEEALAALYLSNTPGEMVLHIDEAIRQLTLMSTQIGDAYPHQVGGLRALQKQRDDVQS